MKDIKKLLREQAQNVLPDESVKQNIRRELGMAQPTQEQAALAHGGTKTLSSKKTWIALTALFLAVALALCLLLPALLKKGGTGGGLNKFTSIETTEDFYLYGAASVGSLLSAREQAAALSAKSLSFAAPAAQELSNSEQEIVDTVNGYLSLVEGLLGDGKIEHSQVAAPSDPAYADYRYYTTIRYKDLLGEAVTYELYYNELLNGVEQEDGEREENYDIEGILVVNGTAYEVYGSREASTEQEPGESESENELQFTAYLNAEKTQYLRMEQKTELETEGNEQESEQEFEYTFVSDGQWQERTEVKYEQEGGELELEIRVEKRGQEKDELRFRRENRQNALDVEAKIGGRDVRFTIEIVSENGNTFYRYRFSGDHSSDAGRFEGSGHRRDDDDD